jgi:hypothetical protein
MLDDEQQKELVAWGIVCVAAFLVALIALTQHPEWFN